MNAPIRTEEALSAAQLAAMSEAEKVMQGKGRCSNRLWEMDLLADKAEALQTRFAFKMNPEDRRRITNIKTILDGMLERDDGRCT